MHLLFRLAPLVALACIACQDADPPPPRDVDVDAEVAPRPLPSLRTTEREPRAVCRTTEERDGVRAVITASTTIRRDSKLVLQQLISAGESTTEVEQTLTLDGKPLMTLRASSEGDRATVEIDYGEAFQGIRNAVSHVEGGTVTGSIDGREILPMPADADPRTAVFADGGRPPTIEIADDIAAAMDVVLADAKAAALHCEGAGVVYASPGHDSDPWKSAACTGCRAGCVGGAIACVAGTLAGCVSSGPFYGLCVGIGLAACALVEYGCFAACSATGAPCCPVGCGEEACCADGETCLDNKAGLCCSPGTLACAGEMCCDTDEVCLATGASAGTCCPAEQTCGNTCCGPLDTCVEDKGYCCPFQAEPCGDTCCEVGGTCLSDGQTCCPAGQDACGPTCCGPNQTCSDPSTGTCQNICPTGSNICEDGSCCPTGKVCSGVPGVCCDMGELYCDGACRPFSECIY